MKGWKKLLLCLMAAVLLWGSFLLGRFTTSGPGQGESDPITFPAEILHAEILERDGAYFHIKELSCNGADSQEEFTFSVQDGTPLMWRGRAINLGDLQPGHRIAVTFTGAVQDICPAVLTEVLHIDLLENKK